MGIKLSKGNKKLGKMPNWSLPAGPSCPGASVECAAFCYAKKGQMRMVHARGIYHANWEEAEKPTFVEDMLAAIDKTKTKVFRIHVSGDFYSKGYIWKWLQIIDAMKDVKFFAYTRSWDVPDLLPALERLRSLPNMELFASVDPSMGDPPKYWRVAYMEGDSRFRKGLSIAPNQTAGIKCPEQAGTMPDCGACGYCFRKKRGNVEFKLH